MSGHISRELRSKSKKNKTSGIKKGKTAGKRKMKKTKNKKAEVEIEYTPQDLQGSTSGSTLIYDNERNILGKKDTSEQQVPIDNNDNTEVIEQNNRQKNFSNDTNNKQSFIWNYLEKLPPTEKYKKRVKCLVKISGQLYGGI